MAAIIHHVGVTASIVDSAVRLHRDVGPGMFESTYEMLLADELERRGHTVARQVVLPLTYRSRRIDQAFRIDLLIDRAVVVEVKACERHSAMFRRQLLTYLRFTRLEVGLVLNFGLSTMKEGIDRVINTHTVP
ncbi:MAG: GxxExxY protein [Gemmatimonas sp.]|jgi:GxxExxY protein|uniref:GxxExxY protein n=1 Tax=Gemmatimonas sp. TaxID=1962908 RepID=UPI0025BA5858|nr:GxxExxY protein [Gemmatimonas sp.]MCE2955179.1 GxxExxY protein [Gemmatimonas sp.]